MDFDTLFEDMFAGNLKQISVSTNKRGDVTVDALQDELLRFTMIIKEGRTRLIASVD